MAVSQEEVAAMTLLVAGAVAIAALSYALSALADEGPDEPQPARRPAARRDA